MNYILTLILTLLIVRGASSQCFVDAGPDIDVCQEGSVQLHGTFEGDVKHVEWTGGKGKFEPSRLLLEAEYTPTADEAGTDVVLTLVASAKNPCEPQLRDEIKLTVNTPVQAIAGQNQQVCKGVDVKLNGQVKGKAKSTTWTTTGSGTFDDPNRLDAIYTPSEKDLADRAVSLTLKAESFGVCGTDESTLVLMFNKGISFSTEKEIITEGTKPVRLTVKINGDAGNVDWTGDVSGIFSKKTLTETTYVPSLEDVEKIDINLKVRVTDSQTTCASEQIVSVHFKGK